MVKNRQKSTHKTNRSIPRIAYLFVLIIITMQISLVSAAWEFDNVKSYNPETKTATITNAFGLGETIAEVTLNSPQEVKVLPGNDVKVAEFTINNFNDYDDVFGTMEFYIYRSEIEVSKEFVYKYKTNEDISVDEYESQCSNRILGNGTNQEYNCKSIKTGSHIENQVVWNILDEKAQLKSGIITIGIFTDVSEGEEVEWIPNLFGKRIKEWAAFVGSIKFEFSEDVQQGGIVRVNNWEGIRFIVGGVGFNANFNLTGFSFHLAEEGTPARFSVMLAGVNASGAPDYTNLLSINTTIDTSQLGTSPTRVWYNVSMPSFILLAGTNYSIILNSSSVAGSNDVEIGINNSGSVYGTALPAFETWFSTNNGSTWAKSGTPTFDGFQIWGEPVNTIVILNSPEDNFISPINDIEFNCSAITGVGSNLVNISLYHNGTGTFELNQTSSITGITNTTIFTAPFIDGEAFSWNCRACDDNSDCSFALANRSVSVDTISPSVVIDFPVGQIESFAFGNTLDLNWTISDLNLNTCWFLYNGANTTVTCTDTGTTFTPVIGKQSLIMFANDTANNVASNTTTWTYGFLEQNVSFNNKVFETSSQKFQLNLSTDIDVLTIDSFLIYNGERDRSIASCDAEGNCTLINIIDVPLVSQANESENKSFFWSLSIFNGTDSINLNTSTRQQNVSKIHLEECGGDFNVVTLNFTAFDEQNLTIINPFLFDGDFNTWLGGGSVKRQSNISAGSVSSEALCLFPNATHSIDGQVTYDHPTSGKYVERNYWFQNDTISNVTQNIELGLLLSAQSTSFILKVQDTNILPVSEVLIFTERFYPGEGVFKIVQVAKTDDNGASVGFFETETADYRFILKQQATTVLQTNDQKIVGETAPFTLTFTIGEPEPPAWKGFEDVSQLEQSLTFNSSSSIITFVYSDTSGEFFSGRLQVLRLMSNGTANVVVCNKTSFQSSATLFCDLSLNKTGTYSAQGIITRDSDSFIDQLLVQIVIGINDFTDIAGDYGLFLGWLVILVSCFAFKFNEIAGIFMINVAVIGVNMIGLIHFGVVFISAMIALSIFIAVVLER